MRLFVGRGAIPRTVIVCMLLLLLLLPTAAATTTTTTPWEKVEREQGIETPHSGKNTTSSNGKTWHNGIPRRAPQR
jgi:hypothetical protein